MWLIMDCFVFSRLLTFSASSFHSTLDDIIQIKYKVILYRYTVHSFIINIIHNTGT